MFTRLKITSGALLLITTGAHLLLTGSDPFDTAVGGAGDSSKKEKKRRKQLEKEQRRLHAKRMQTLRNIQKQSTQPADFEQATPTIRDVTPVETVQYVYDLEASTKSLKRFGDLVRSSPVIEHESIVIPKRYMVDEVASVLTSHAPSVDVTTSAIQKYDEMEEIMIMMLA